MSSNRSDDPAIGSHDSFRDLMLRVRAGSEDAAWELVERYGGYIRRAVRRVLDHRMRTKFDSLDFVQLAWQSFFRMRDQIDRFERPQHLVMFLAGVASNKVRMEARRRLATEKYGGGREVPMWHLSPDREGLNSSNGPDPEPVSVAIARERWERLIEDQPAHCRQMIQLRLQGHTLGEIGSLLNVDKGNVQRFLKKLLDATSP
jgi:RNA polymerase sigma factor (sigma-70 family)